jgi:hypothetical protein
MEDDLRKKRFYRNTMLSLNNAKAILRDLQSKLMRENEDISELKRIVSDLDRYIVNRSNMEKRASTEKKNQN